MSKEVISNESTTGEINPLVSNYYNSKKDTELQFRPESRIFYLRNFNNWIKSVLIKEHIIQINRHLQKKNRESTDEKIANAPYKYININVIDLGCGRGGDMKKWIKSMNVKNVVFADTAELSLDECKERYSEMKAKFKADFVHMDITKDLFENKLNDFNQIYDLVSCQFVLHYSFETFDKVINVLKNVSNALKPGGYFIGTTTDSCEIVKRLKESTTHDASNNRTYGNDVFKITSYFDVDEKIPLFGAKIDFKLDDVVNCPEYLIYFPLLEKLALKYNLKLVFKKSFLDFFKEFSEQDEYKELLKIMKSLEVYKENCENYLKSSNLNDYKHVRDYYMKRKESLLKSMVDTSSSDNNNPNIDNDKLNIELGTLSKSEWEAATLYVAFAFQKF